MSAQNYPSVTDEEFAELGYTRERAMWMYGLDVECDVVNLRKKKMGLEIGNFADHIQYMEVYEPNRVFETTMYYYSDLLNGGAYEVVRRKDE